MGNQPVYVRLRHSIQHTVAVVQSTVDNNNSHSCGCIQCQQWSHMTQCTDVVVTQASDIDDVIVLVERQC